MQKQPLEDSSIFDIKEFRIHCLKKDTIFIYQTLESLEGLCSFSTLPFKKDDSYRFILVQITQGNLSSFENIFLELKKFVQPLELLSN